MAFLCWLSSLAATPNKTAVMSFSHNAEGPKEAKAAPYFFWGNPTSPEYIEWLRSSVRDGIGGASKMKDPRAVAEFISRKSAYAYIPHDGAQRGNCNLIAGVAGKVSEKVPGARESRSGCCLAAVKDIGLALGLFDHFSTINVANEFGEYLINQNFKELPKETSLSNAPDKSIAIWSCPNSRKVCGTGKGQELSVEACGHVAILIKGLPYADVPGRPRGLGTSCSVKIYSK